MCSMPRPVRVYDDAGRTLRAPGQSVRPMVMRDEDTYEKVQNLIPTSLQFLNEAEWHAAPPVWRFSADILEVVTGNKTYTNGPLI